jgi:hypothetical protein
VARSAEAQAVPGFEYGKRQNLEAQRARSAKIELGKARGDKILCLKVEVKEKAPPNHVMAFSMIILEN